MALIKASIVPLEYPKEPINNARKPLLYLWHIFTIKPLAAVSIVLCLATILSCVMLERKRPHQGADRFLIGFLGLLSVYQAIRILHAAGIVKLAVNAQAG